MSRELEASRCWAQRLMEKMGVCSICPKPAKSSAKHSCLLKNKAIRFPNQVASRSPTFR